MTGEPEGEDDRERDGGLGDDGDVRRLVLRVGAAQRPGQQPLAPERVRVAQPALFRAAAQAKAPVMMKTDISCPSQVPMSSFAGTTLKFR